ncbi:MAG: outer membrane protein assembly factor BamD [Deltaproteobacteria bacterium]|nr:MAG: outer membrane protein assembly factor BamD [Deltaproteobacteria bacterium]
MRRILVLSTLVILAFFFLQKMEAPSERLYFEAMDLSSLGSWEEAEARFQRVVEQYPHSRLAPRALLRLGDIYGFQEKDFSRALETYDRLVESYPQSDIVPVALLRKAEILRERMVDPVGSMEVLTRILQHYPGFPETERVLILMARNLEEVQQFTREKAYLKRLLLEFPGSPYAEEASYRYAMACLGEGSIDEALLSFKNFFATYPGSRFAARAEIGYAEALKEKHGRSDAIEYLADAMDRYDDEEKGLLKERIESLKSRVPLSKIRIPRRRRHR